MGRSILPGLLNPRRRSLLRGNLLVIASLMVSFRLSHFPTNHATLWLLIPVLVATAGTVDTIRCMRPRWDFYHGGVILCIYMDLMALTMIALFLCWPYMLPFTSAR